MVNLNVIFCSDLTSTQSGVSMSLKEKRNCTCTLNVLITVHVEKLNIRSLDCNLNA